MQFGQTQTPIRMEMMPNLGYKRAPAFGFSGRAFPLLAFILAFISYILTYIVARTKSPPDVRPIGQTDILHPAIHYPEYLIYRIGMLVYPVCFCISFQTLKNFLQMKSFEFKGQSEPRLNAFGPCSIIGCLSLCISTAAISDGGDLNYFLYYNGSRLYWALALFMIYRSSGIYRDLWQINRQFVPSWSFEFKNYSGIIVIILVAAYILQLLDMLNVGYFPEWIISLYIISFVLTLYWDLKDMDLLLRRK